MYFSPLAARKLDQLCAEVAHDLTLKLTGTQHMPRSGLLQLRFRVERPVRKVCHGFAPWLFWRGAYGLGYGYERITRIRKFEIWKIEVRNGPQLSKVNLNLELAVRQYATHFAGR
jgi:hypothetical protein